MTFAEYISEAICNGLASERCFENGKIWGIVEQVQKGTETFPVFNNRGMGQDVKPDSRYPIQVYMRVLDSSRDETGEGFGIAEYQHTLRMLIVAVGDIRRLDGCFDSQSSLVDLLTRSIDLQYQFLNWYGISTGRIRKNTDKRDILQREFRGLNWESRILDLIAVSVEVEFTGTECDVICITPDPDCETQTLTVSWLGNGEDGAIVYNGENNCAYFFQPVPEFANQTVRICSVSYSANNLSTVNPNGCDLFLTAEIIESEANIQNGTYNPCVLCEPTGQRTTLVTGADPLGSAFTNGNHTGAITQCQNNAFAYGADVGVWFRVWFDCEACEWFANEPPTLGQVQGDIVITINYKEC